MWIAAAQSPNHYYSQHLLMLYRIFSHVYPKELSRAVHSLSKDQIKYDIWPVIIIYKKLMQTYDSPKRF